MVRPGTKLRVGWIDPACELVSWDNVAELSKEKTMRLEGRDNNRSNNPEEREDGKRQRLEICGRQNMQISCKEQEQEQEQEQE